MKYLASFCLAAFTCSALAEEIPAVTVSKSDRLPIAIAGLSPADAKVLQNDLAMSGAFAVGPAAGAQFLVTALGSVNDRAGRSVLQKSYGAGRAAIHAFADDLVETLTGTPGIAATKVAFVATKTGRKEIYTCDADGAGMVQLTRDGAISVAPSLSADGRRLLYTGYQSGYADVYEVALGSGARTRIMKYPGTNSGATFSPDGSRIAVTLSKDGNPELYVTGSGGGGARRLTRTAGVESSPTWSPDGSEIIYSSDDQGSPRLYRIGAGGGGARAISTGHGYNTEPNWSPDGRKVAFNVRSGGFQVAIHDLAGGGTRIVGEGQDPAWGANSRHLIFASGGSLVMLDTVTGQRTTVASGLGRISEPTWSR